MENKQIKRCEHDYIVSSGKYRVEGDFIFMPEAYVLVSEFLSTVRHGGRITVKTFDGSPISDLDTPIATGYIAELNFYEIDENENYVTDRKYIAVPGDLNGDGAVDARDIALMNRLCDGDELLLSDKFSKSGLYAAAAGGCINKENAEKLKEKLLSAKSVYHKITVNGGSIAAYGIVKPKSCSPLWSGLVDVFIRTVKKHTCVELPTVNGSAACPKIIIESPVKSPLSSDYEIKTDGADLIIEGRDDESIYSALNMLISRIAEGDCDLGPATGEKGNGDYVLVYGDDFDGEELDRRIWDNCSWNPEERVSIFQIYDEENDRNITVEESEKLSEKLVKQRDAEGVKLVNGCMEVPVICSDTENYKTAVYETHQPVTEDRMLYRYGLLEIRAKLPKFPATTALWTLGGGVEIDLVEGSQKPGSTGYSFHANVHMPNPKGEGRRIAHSYERYNKTRYFATDEDLTEDFHIYSFRWTPDVIEFAVDGNIFWTLELNEFDTGDIMSKCEHYIFTGASYGSTFTAGERMAAYGYDAKTVNDWVAKGNRLLKETTLYVDYVRLYQDKTEKNGYFKIID